MNTIPSPFPRVATREPAQQCPVCEQALPNERAGLVRARLEARERELAAAVKSRLQEEFSAEKTRIESAALATTEAIRKEAAAALEKAGRDAAERETAARDEAAAEVRAEIGRALADAQRERTEAMLRLDALRAEQDEVIAARLEEERAAMEKEKEDLVTGIKVKHFEEKQRLTSRL